MKARSFFALSFLFLPLLTFGESTPRQSGKILGTGKSKPTITLTAPSGGWTVDRMVEVAGKVSDATINPITININGARYMLRVNADGNFKRKFPVTTGKNAITVSGTNAGGRAEASRTVFAKIDSVAIMAILTSDTDGVYTDLHIYEPSPNESDKQENAKDHNVHVYWASTSSPTGGSFYLNEQAGEYDQPGYGPYLYTHRSPPLGIYRIDANYWPSGDKAHTLSTLNLILFGGTSNEIRRSIQSPLVMPGETSTLVWIKIEKGQKATVYSPILDEKPKDTKIWPKWVLDFKPRRAGSESESM